MPCIGFLVIVFLIAAVVIGAGVVLLALALIGTSLLGLGLSQVRVPSPADDDGSPRKPSRARAIWMALSAGGLMVAVPLLAFGAVILWVILSSVYNGMILPDQRYKQAEGEKHTLKAALTTFAAAEQAYSAA